MEHCCVLGVAIGDSDGSGLIPGLERQGLGSSNARERRGGPRERKVILKPLPPQKMPSV